MLKKISAATLAVAAIVLAGPAMAQQLTNQTYNTNVQIQVAAEVSMWAGDNIVLLMNGAPGGNNAAATESTITHINNVAADINVTVNGDLPTPQVTGGGILFYIFKNTDQATAFSAINANPYGPAGALVWQDGTENTTQLFANALPAGPSTQDIVVSYGSASPGELPAVQNVDLDVVWTISSDT